MSRYCQWKEEEISLCSASGSPLEAVNAKINFISNLIVSNSVDMKDRLQVSQISTAEEQVKRY